MRFARFLALVLPLLLAGCLGSAVMDPGGDDAPAPPKFGDGEGTITMTAKVDSVAPVTPAAALPIVIGDEDDLTVRFRVMQQQQDYNLIGEVPVPTDGEAKLAVQVPAGAGFQVASVSYVTIPNSSNGGQVLSSGWTEAVSVFADTNTDVELIHSSIQFDIDAPEKLRAGEKGTVKLTLIDPPPIFLNLAVLKASTTPPDADDFGTIGAVADLNQVGGNLEASFNFHAPMSDGTVKLYLQVMVRLDESWRPIGANVPPLWHIAPSLERGETLVVIDIEAP